LSHDLDMGGSSSVAKDVGVKGVDITPVEAEPTSSWWASIAYNGKFYGIPSNADKLLTFDPSSSSVTGVDITNISTGKGKWRAAVALGGKIYGIPDHADSVLVFDPQEGVAKGIDTRRIARGPLKWESAVVVGGKIYVFLTMRIRY